MKKQKDLLKKANNILDKIEEKKAIIYAFKLSTSHYSYGHAHQVEVIQKDITSLKSDYDEVVTELMTLSI